MERNGMEWNGMEWNDSSHVMPVRAHSKSWCVTPAESSCICMHARTLKLNYFVKLTPPSPFLDGRLGTKLRSQIETSAEKNKNCRIDTIYPLSFPDFNRSVGNSIVKCRLMCWKCPKGTVGSMLRTYGLFGLTKS